MDLYFGLTSINLGHVRTSFATHHHVITTDATHHHVITTDAQDEGEIVCSIINQIDNEH